MSGKYGSASASIILDDHGGTPRDITGHVLTLGGVKIAQINEENSPFGSASEKNTPVGKQKAIQKTLHGNFDTTPTTGPHVMFSTLETSPQDSSRTLTISPGDSKSYSGEVFATEYELVFTNGKLTGYNAVLEQAGAFAWS